MKGLETIEQKEIIKRDDLYKLYEELKIIFYNIPTVFYNNPENLLKFINDIEKLNKYKEEDILKLKEYYRIFCLYQKQDNSINKNKTGESKLDTEEIVDSNKGIVERILEKIGFGKSNDLVKSTNS